MTDAINVILEDYFSDKWRSLDIFADLEVLGVIDEYRIEISENTIALVEDNVIRLCISQKYKYISTIILDRELPDEECQLSLKILFAPNNIKKFYELMRHKFTIYTPYELSALLQMTRNVAYLINQINNQSISDQTLLKRYYQLQRVRLEIFGLAQRFSRTQLLFTQEMNFGIVSPTAKWLIYRAVIDNIVHVSLKRFDASMHHVAQHLAMTHFLIDNRETERLQSMELVPALPHMPLRRLNGMRIDRIFRLLGDEHVVNMQTIKSIAEKFDNEDEFMAQLVRPVDTMKRVELEEWQKKMVKLFHSICKRSDDKPAPDFSK